MSNDTTQITDEKIERIVLSITKLATTNVFATVIFKSVENKPIEEQRKVITSSYAMLYELMLTMQMAMDSKKLVGEIKEDLGV